MYNCFCQESGSSFPLPLFTKSTKWWASCSFPFWLHDQLLDCMFAAAIWCIFFSFGICWKKQLRAHGWHAQIEKCTNFCDCMIICWIACLHVCRSHLMHDACYICCMFIRLHMFALVFIYFFKCSLNRLNSAVIPLFVWETILLKAKCCMALHKLKLLRDECFFSFFLNLLDCCVCASALNWMMKALHIQDVLFLSSPFLWLVDFSFFFLSSFSFLPGVNLARQPVSRLLVRFDLIRSACKFLSAFLFPCPIPPSFCLFCFFWILCTQPLLIS